MTDTEEDNDTDDNGCVLSVPLLYAALAEMMAFKSGMIGALSNIWELAVHGTLVDVEVQTIKDFVRVVLDLDRMLSRRGHPQLGKATLRMMLAEACL
jgi:hypothetical protein